MTKYKSFKKNYTNGAKPCRTCPVRHNALFNDISDHNLDKTQLVRSRQIIRPAGTSLFDENEIITSMYTLYSGWAIFYKVFPSGKRQILNFALPGDLIGMDIRDEGRSSYSVKTLTHSVLCVFSKVNLSKLLQTDNLVTQRYINMRTRDMSIYQAHLENIGQKTAEERIVFLLLELFYRSHNQDPNICSNANKNRMKMPLTQEDIGDAMGLTKVHVNRVLSKLMNKGLLECNRGMLLLRNHEELIDIAQFNKNILTVPNVFNLSGVN